ncbi:hypothetical protein Tco_0270639 [Tanacetum coccineum]
MPVDKNWVFSPPPTPNTLIEFVNELGYPREVMHLSNVTTNDMFQHEEHSPTKQSSILSLTGKTSNLNTNSPSATDPRGVVNQSSH